MFNPDMFTRREMHNNSTTIVNIVSITAFIIAHFSMYG